MSEQLIGNAWVNRIDQLRQYVSDVNDAPESEEDIEWYVAQWMERDDAHVDDAEFLRKEFREHYGID